MFKIRRDHRHRPLWSAPVPIEDPLLQAGEPTAPPDIQAAVSSALAELDKRHRAWSDAVRQDAVESAPRLGWWLLVRRGCRIPAFDLYTVPMRRAVDTISRRFIEEGAPQVARHLGKSPASLIMAGKVCISELVLDSQTFAAGVCVSVAVLVRACVCACVCESVRE